MSGWLPFAETLDPLAAVNDKPEDLQDDEEEEDNISFGSEGDEDDAKSNDDAQFPVEIQNQSCS